MTRPAIRPAIHHCLEIKLHHDRTIFLAGNLWHSTNEFVNGIAPKNIIDAQQTAASVRHIKSLALETHAVIISSHKEMMSISCLRFPGPSIETAS